MPRPSALTPWLVLVATLLHGCAGAPDLPDLPDRHGRGGMAAVTVLDERGEEAILAAGGCNFPEGPPWEGGVKRYYRDVLLLSRHDGVWAWSKVGELPHDVAYAAFTATPDRRAMVIAGGCDEKSHHSTTLVVGADGKVHLRFRGVAGRSYRVLRAEVRLDSGWSPISEVLIPATDGVLELTDNEPGTGAGSLRFYRVQTPAAP